MKLSQVIIVLCRPSESRNIGSVCRSMLAMGIFRLRIVGKKSDYNQEQVTTLAVHAQDVWEQAIFFDTLGEAVADCVIVAGTTRRRGQKRKNILLLPEEFANHVANIPNSTHNAKGNLAVVFGNERTGLTDEELSACTMGLTIPTDDTFGSLNLSHAVQIITYEIFRSCARQKNPEHIISQGYTPISIQRADKTVAVLIKSLESIGFFKQAGKKDMEHFWKNILTKAILSEGETSYIERVFTKIAGLHQKTKLTSSPIIAQADDA